MRLTDFAPRLALARDQRRAQPAEESRFALVIAERRLDLERLVAHRDLQLVRAYSSRSPSYIGTRQRKLAAAQRAAAAFEQRHPLSQFPQTGAAATTFGLARGTSSPAKDRRRERNLSHDAVRAAGAQMTGQDGRVDPQGSPNRTEPRPRHESSTPASLTATRGPIGGGL